MRVHLYHRKGESPHWQALVRVGGKRYRFSCHTTHKVRARQLAEKRVRELEERHERGLLGLPTTLRISEVFDRYEREYAPKLRPSATRRMMDVVRQACCVQVFQALPLQLQSAHASQSALPEYRLGGWTVQGA